MNDSYQSENAEVNGVTIHYLMAGTGNKTLVLIHGFGTTSDMWIPFFDEFAKDYTIVAPDLRGLGGSSKTAAGYDKKTLADDIHELVKGLGYPKINLVGHDIGLMVAYAYAAQYPDEVEKLALLEALIPGVGDIWDKVFASPALWHFHFVHSPIALELVKGRERIFLEHFWQTLSPHPETFFESERQRYARAYAQEGAMRAAFEMFKAFNNQDAADNRYFAASKLKMPVLTMEGDKAKGGALEIQARLIATKVTSIVIPDTGHWLVEERPVETKAALKTFFDKGGSMTEAVRATEETAKGADGLRIFVRVWRPNAEVRGVVTIVPGFNSHSAYYTWVARQFVARRLAVYALDLRGRGQSDGERFYVEKFSDYVSDVASVITLTKVCHPGLPTFLLGHSAGGVVACLYTLDHPGELGGLICESFAHDLPAPNFALAVFKGLSHLAPHAHVLHLKNEIFSRDPKVVEAMNNDPLIAHETQPTRTVAEMVRADERLKKEFPLITLPMLILHGTADRATKASGSQRFFDMAGSGDKTLKLYEGHFHDLLNDVGKEAVMVDIQTWIDARLPA